jgi:hypoxanthine phosphoribosyltransferase
VTVRKTFISADTLLEDSFKLAKQILRSGLRPSHIVGIWRGGAPIGIAVQEFLEFRGVACEHSAIRTSSYTGIDCQEPTVKVYALGYLIDTLNAEDVLLVVDDVFDSGRSIEAFLSELGAKCRRNMPQTVKIATVFHKPSRNKTDLVPDYYVEETEDWLVFPHELQGLSNEEIRAHKPAAEQILQSD